jgi:hypothetical protein
MEELKLRIHQSNGHALSYKSDFLSKFGEEVGPDLLLYHIINPIKEPVGYGIEFWNSFDFTNLNFFDIYFLEAEKMAEGYLIGSIGGDFFILNDQNQVLITNYSSEPLLDFEELIEFVVILIRLSLLNYTDQLSSGVFKTSLMELKNSNSYHHFLEKYFDVG